MKKTCEITCIPRLRRTDSAYGIPVKLIRLSSTRSWCLPLRRSRTPPTPLGSARYASLGAASNKLKRGITYNDLESNRKPIL